MKYCPGWRRRDHHCEKDASAVTTSKPALPLSRRLHIALTDKRISGLIWQVGFTRAMIGGFDVDLVREFFQGFVNHAQLTLHVDNLRGDNAHHQCETVFKAFGRALRMSLQLDPDSADAVPSTKGTL